MAAPDAWQEQFLFSLQRKSGSAVEFAGITEDITGFDFGDKDVEGVALANGGRVAKWTPQADESMTIKVWPTDVKYSDGTGVAQWFNPQTTDDDTEPISVSNTRLRKLHQAVFLWAEDINTATYSAAGTATLASDAAYRITVKNAYITSYKLSFDDKNMSAEITLKWMPFAKDATSNKTEESTDGSSQLTAVVAFT